MIAEQLHVVAARANPLRWKAPDRIYRDWAEHMLDSGVKLTVVECQYGEREFTAALPHVNHIGVRATTWCWSKENLLNIGISRIPGARYICWSDSDIFHRQAHWATETLHALQNYHIVQPWSEAYDLGPDREISYTHASFCKVFHQGGPLVPEGSKFWKSDGGPYQYPHSGYVWAATGCSKSAGWVRVIIIWRSRSPVSLVAACQVRRRRRIVDMSCVGRRARSGISTATSAMFRPRSSIASTAGSPTAAMARAGACSSKIGSTPMRT